MPKGVGSLYYGSNSGAWPWAAANSDLEAGGNKHSSSSRNAGEDRHNSEASTNARFGPPAKSESGNNNRNIDGTGTGAEQEGPCDPVPVAAPAIAPAVTPTSTSASLRDKRPVVREKKGVVDPAGGSLPTSVIRKQQQQHEPVTAQTGEQPAETGGSNSNSGSSSSSRSRRGKEGYHAAEPRDATEGEGEGAGELPGEETDEEQERILAEFDSGVLDVFSDPYCNKHLVYAILELVLVRLVPELTERGVLELWEERLN